jgi:hypothetical protein
LTERHITFIDEIGSRVPFFNKLGEAQRRELYKVVELVQLKPGEVLFKAGDTGDAIYVVIMGTLDLFMSFVQTDPIAAVSSDKLKAKLFKETASERGEDASEVDPASIPADKQYIAGTYGPMATFGDNVT